jgi:hypothetical protein
MEARAVTKRAKKGKKKPNVFKPDTYHQKPGATNPLPFHFPKHFTVQWISSLLYFPH